MDEWRKFIPRPLFTAKDGSPISAILYMKDKSAAKFIMEIFEDLGGSILKTPNPFTIFLTDTPSKYKSHPKHPVFDIKWILNCIDSVELLEINPYLINRDSFIRRDFMEVIFEKRETSEGVILVENQIFEDDLRNVYREKPVKKPTRRRGPPKRRDHVLIEVDHLSQEDDFNSHLAESIVTEAIENILLNDRSIISKAKEKYK